MILYKYLAVLISLTAHEYFYYLTIYIAGNKTSEIKKRLSLNPYRHFDAFGSLILPILMLIINLLAGTGIPSFAYSKRHNNSTVKNESPFAFKLMNILSASLINFLLALFSALALITTNTGFIQSFLIFFTEINILFCIMNLIPLLPLDIFHILLPFFKTDQGKKIARARVIRFLYIFIMLETPLFSAFHAKTTMLFTDLVKNIVSLMLVFK